MRICNGGYWAAARRGGHDLKSVSHPSPDRAAGYPLRPRRAAAGARGQTAAATRIIRRGDRGDAAFFIASGAVEVRLPARRVRLGTGEFFGEMAMLSGKPRQADVVSLTYCRLLLLRKADFERFLAANPDVKAKITRIARTRLSLNQEDAERTAESVSN